MIYKKVQCGVLNLGAYYEELVPAYLALELVKDKDVKEFKLALNPSSYAKFDDLVVEVENEDGRENFAIQLKHREPGRSLLDVEEFCRKGRGFEVIQYKNAYYKLDPKIQQTYKFLLFTNAKFTNIKSSKNFNIKQTRTSFKTSIFNTDNILQFTEIQNTDERFYNNFFLFSDQLDCTKLREKITKIFIEDFHSDENTAILFMTFFGDIRRALFNNTEIDKKTVVLKLLTLLLSDCIIKSPFEKVWDENLKLLERAIEYFDVIFFDENSNFDTNEIDKEVPDGIKELSIKHKLSFLNQNLTQSLLDKLSSYFYKKLLFVKLTEENKLLIISLIKLCKNIKTLKIRFVLVGEKCIINELEPLTTFSNLADLKNVDYVLYNDIIATVKISLQGRRIETMKILQNEFGYNLDKIITPGKLFLYHLDTYPIGDNIEPLPKPYMERFLTRPKVSKISDLEKLCKNTKGIMVHDKGESEALKTLNHTFYPKLLLTNEENCKNCFYHLNPSKNNYMDWVFPEVSPDSSEIFDNNLNIIFGNPGTGKTTMMKYLARKCPLNYWVINVLLHQQSRNFISKDKIVSQLENLVTKNQNIEKLEKQNNCMFFFDGLDELSNTFLNNVIEAINVLVEKGYKCWIACTKRLENNVCTKLKLYTIYYIEELKSKEQESYIRQNITNKNISEEDLDAVVEKIISSAGLYKYFLKTPLCLFILTQIINKAENPKILNDFLNIADLYSHFVDKQVQHKLMHVEDTISLETVINFFKDLYLEECQIAALKVCFEPADFDSLRIKNHKRFLKQIKENGDFLGIIKMKPDDTPEFIHLSFAQYFAALWLSENLESIPRDQRKFLFNSKYFEIFNFLNPILAENHPLHLAICNRNVSTVCEIADAYIDDRDKGGRTPLHLISSMGLKHQIVEEEDAICKQTDFMDEIETQILKYILAKSEKESLLLTDKLSMNCFQYADANLCLSFLEEMAKKEELQYHYLENYKDLRLLSDACVRFGYISLLQKIFEWEKLEDVENKDAPLLYLAIENYQEEILSFLLQRETYFMKIDYYQQTPLHIAALYNNIRVVKELVRKDVDLEMTDFETRTPINIAAKMGHIEIVKILVENGAKIDAKDRNGRTSLHNSSYTGKTEIVEYLIENGANVNCLDSNHTSPLQLAALMERFETIKCLIKHNADIEAIDEDKGTILHYAVSKQNLDILKYLIDKNANIFACDVDGKTAFQLAKDGGNETVVEILRNAENIQRLKIKSTCHLYGAVLQGNFEETSKLLTSGADIEEEFDDNETVLHIAAKGGYVDIVDLLLKMGANSSVQNSDGRIPLHLAAQRGHVKVVQLLLRKEDINVTDKWHLTPLHRAAYKGHKTTVQLLLAAGAEFIKTVNKGESPLHSAARGGHTDILEYFISKNFDIWERTKGRETALHLAARCGKADTVVYLLNKSKDMVDSIDHFGRTALHWAVERGCKWVTQCLLDAGADVNKMDYLNKTALDIAKEAKRDKIILCLQEKI